MAKLYFYKISTKEPIFKKQIEGKYVQINKNRTHEFSKDDYILILHDRNIHLWKVNSVSEIGEDSKFDCDEIIENINITADDLMHIKGFVIKSRYVNLIRQNQSLLFFETEKDVDFNYIIQKEYLEDKNNIRKILIRENRHFIEEDSRDIQLYLENDELKLYPADFIDDEIINNFRDNRKVRNGTRKRKDKSLDKIDKAINEKTFEITNKMMSFLYFYDATCVDYDKPENDDSQSNEEEKSKMEQNDKIAHYTKILGQKKNIILQGAPGTGKTYNTAALALSICGVDISQFKKHKDLMEEYNKLRYDQKEKPNGQIGFVTFHQSMDYEDFVEGIKPEIAQNEKGENVGINYDVKPGIFKELCDKSSKTIKPHVLIIDEINRGNVSKIFGELITLLEADKRLGGEHPISVTLPYSKAPFSVPSNLYIIGTMNTTDRSVGNIDYAVRRRFAFVTLEADRNILIEKYGEESLNVKLFDAVKTFLDDKDNKSEMDIDDLMVGHSYFMADDENELRLKLEYEIIPLLSEYYKDGIITKAVPKISDTSDEDADFIQNFIEKLNDSSNSDSNSNGEAEN